MVFALSNPVANETSYDFESVDGKKELSPNVPQLRGMGFMVSHYISAVKLAAGLYYNSQTYFHKPILHLSET